MKKKVIFAVATGLFALATVFNMNVLQSNSAGDVSLESIAVMAQAQSGENSSENKFPLLKERVCLYEDGTQLSHYGTTCKDVDWQSTCSSSLPQNCESTYNGSALVDEWLNEYDIE